MDRPRSWWRRVWAALAPARSDIEERLAGRYAAEERLAQGLEQAGEALARYPQARSRVLAAAERARGRALRLRRTPRRWSPSIRGSRDCCTTSIGKRRETAET
jgi:hypothetical protein